MEEDSDDDLLDCCNRLRTRLDLLYRYFKRNKFIKIKFCSYFKYLFERIFKLICTIESVISTLIFSLFFFSATLYSY